MTSKTIDTIIKRSKAVIHIGFASWVAALALAMLGANADSPSFLFFSWGGCLLLTGGVLCSVFAWVAGRRTKG